jgi:ribosomal-protein-alanine N-acetyltransferase
MNINTEIYRITDVRKDDLFAICQIENSSYKFPWSQQAIIDQIINKNAYNRSIYIDNNSSTSNDSILVGYIFGYTVLNDIYITNICIHPDFLKRKFASKLLETLFLDANVLNIKSIFLEVRKSNFAAISLYKKFQFDEDGERKNFYSDGESAILMHKDII